MLSSWIPRSNTGWGGRIRTSEWRNQIRCLTLPRFESYLPHLLEIKDKVDFRHPQNGHFYVACVAKFSLIISTGAIGCRRLHATYVRHTAVVCPHNASSGGRTFRALRISGIRSARNNFKCAVVQSVTNTGPEGGTPRPAKIEIRLSN